MGLGIEVGALADLKKHDPEGAGWVAQDMVALNELLAAEGLPAHREPEVFDTPVLPHVASFPYSFLHYLRRAFAHTRDGRPTLAPAPPSFDPGSDPYLDEELTLFMSSHLCCHSDAEGYYLPIDFPDVLYGDIPGGMVGSSHALSRELLQVAPLLAIPLSGTTISAATAESLANTGDDHPFFRERLVWGALFANALASIESGSAIRFG